jgi:uncharacterized protein (TIGR01777 family)
MHVLVSGASGLVGSSLVPQLEDNGHQVTRLVRRKRGQDEVRWYPAKGVLPENLLENVEGVVNLSGESIAEGRWNAAKKTRILESRLQTTQLLATSLTKLDPQPKVWVSASAIGYYGDRGDELLDENAAAGSGYLADVCQQWEAATKPASDAGIRVVNLRIGVVLSKDGGALKKMLLPFKMGGGGIVGNGKQYWSCIGITDLVGAIQHCLLTESLSGPVNAVSCAVTNYDFTKALGRVLKRPTIMPLPGFAAKIVLGEMAEALLLASARVVPKQLQTSGYPFQHADIESSLRGALDA